MFKLNINGKTVEVEAEAGTPLLWVLRDHLDLTGTKYGCGVAACGSCTVLLGDMAVRACSTPVQSAVGQKVVTVEGLAGTRLGKAVQAAWLKHDVAQCGYCQSGQMMSAVALLARKRRPSEADIDGALAGNICRCGTYQRIRAAIKDAAQSLA